MFDGINCKVTKNGLNAFGDSNVVEFPKLRPGKNIYIAQHSSPVKVEFVTEYYPTFIWGELWKQWNYTAEGKFILYRAYQIGA